MAVQNNLSTPFEECYRDKSSGWSRIQILQAKLNKSATENRPYFKFLSC